MTQLFFNFFFDVIKTPSFKLPPEFLIEIFSDHVRKFIYYFMHTRLMIRKQFHHFFNMHIKNIEKMMKLLANHKASMHKIIDKLSYVIAKNFYQEFWRELKGRSFYDIKKEVKKQLSHLFNSGQETKIWQENCLKRNTGSEASLIDRTSRLARDFIKLRKSILNLSSEKGESKAILESLRDQNFSFSRTGSSHRHAEMRQMYAFSNLTSQERKASYIGISKLSCRRCSSVTKSLGIPTRGQHGRVFKQWEAPRFFKKDPDLLEKFFGN